MWNIYQEAFLNIRKEEFVMVDKWEILGNELPSALVF